MQNNINFFGWIRDGVKQSVLQGVSDAIVTIGTPEESPKLHPQVAALLANNGGNSNPLLATNPIARIAANTTGTASQKRRLGRSLKDIEPA